MLSSLESNIGIIVLLNVASQSGANPNKVNKLPQDEDDDVAEHNDLIIIINVIINAINIYHTSMDVDMVMILYNWMKQQLVDKLMNYINPLILI